MNIEVFSNLSYIISAILFIFGLKMLSKPDTARRGNIVSSSGMLLAIITTLLLNGLSYKWILIGMAIGGTLGAMGAYLVAMTAIPQMVGLMNGCGGMASFLVAWAAYHHYPDSDVFTSFTTFFSTLVGSVTFTGSCIAWAKLDERISGKPIVFPGIKFFTISLLLGVLACGVLFSINPIESYNIYIGIIVIALILGILLVIPIGGADMPVVISLLNSYSGIAACASGFVIKNNILIVAGALVGASGIILTNIMCKAMNRSLANVLFGGLNVKTQKQGAGTVKGEVKSMLPADAYLILEAARSVVFVPGYGMAVAQAQHVVRELGELLENNGAEVSYAIHPVAGRMPGHMNVLLAEANVSYDQLFEMDDINPMMDSKDVAIVIGANDVVNPAARHDESSPMYGMPIINVDKAKTVFVLKRSMATGFSGIQNELFYYDNVRMIFGDAKQTIQNLVTEFKG